MLQAAFAVCLEDDQLGLKENPMLYVKIRKIEEEVKVCYNFTFDQLQVLFDSPVFTAGSRPLGGRGDTAFWAPLIALYTGARLNEIMLLRTDGIHNVKGASVFHFRHRLAMGQELKGKAKHNRKVPVHPELIRLGILDYLKGAVKCSPLPGNAGWLFPVTDRSHKV